MSKNRSIRLAAESDSNAILQIYAPFITNTAITFECQVPTIAEFRDRMAGKAWGRFLRFKINLPLSRFLLTLAIGTEDFLFITVGGVMEQIYLVVRLIVIRRKEKN